MIKLYGFGAAYGQPDMSPFVMKVMILLQMAGVKYERHANAEAIRRAPKGKLPFIEDGEVVVADSRFIKTYLETQYGTDFTGGYTDRELAAGHAIERMLEESSYFCSVHTRWVRPDGWEKINDLVFKPLPFPLGSIVGSIVRRRVRTSVVSQGTGRLSDAEIDEIACQNIDALALLLGEKPYLLGDRACGFDATAAAFITAGSSSAFAGRIQSAVVSKANLMAYRDRVLQTYLPDYPASEI